MSSDYSFELYERLTEILPDPMSTKHTFTVAKDEVTGIFKGTLDIQLPPIIVTKYKADKNDFKYDIQRAVTEVVEEIVAKALDD
jgi:hypothetical protein|tara:strand:- start:3584 stop:3835 length:252 start_codon:yes stop_codon:yes gene_type:complete